MKRSTLQALVALITTASIAIPAPALAATSAELQAELAVAQSELDALYAEAEEAGQRLNRTRDDLTATEVQIGELNDDIATKHDELVSAQGTLGKTVSANYKMGPLSLLSLILDSTSFEDLINRIVYADRVSAAYSQQIEDVKAIKAELAEQEEALEAQKAQQEELLAQQEAEAAELDEKAEAAESYVASLDVQIQEALAAEAAARAEAERQAAAEAAAAAQAAASAATGGAAPSATGAATSATTPTPTSTQQTTSQTTAAPTGSSAQQTPAAAESSGEVSNMGARSAVVAYVLAQIGKPYVWATHGPNSFDCSGLTGAAYASIGYSVGYSDSYQAQFCNKPASQAAYGDIVWRPGHVGICIGNGVTVEAHTPATGIGYGSVSNFQRAGSPLG